MKTKFAASAIAWLVVGIALVSCNSTPTPMPDATMPITKIKFAVDASLTPFEFIDSAGQLAGLDIDLMKAIAAKSNLEVGFVKVGFGQLLSLVSNCQIDGAISAIAISDDLKQQMIFSEPYYQTNHVVVVKKGNITITGKDKLVDMIVGAQAGSVSEIELSKITGAKPKPYPTFYLSFYDLTTGYIDAVVSDKPRALSQVNVKPNNLKIVGDGFGNVSYGIAMCKDAIKLNKKISDGLAAVRSDGTLNRLMQKWIKQ